MEPLLARQLAVVVLRRVQRDVRICYIMPQPGGVENDLLSIPLPKGFRELISKLCNPPGKGTGRVDPPLAEFCDRVVIVPRKLCERICTIAIDVDVVPRRLPTVSEAALVRFNRFFHERIGMSTEEFTQLAGHRLDGTLGDLLVSPEAPAEERKRREKQEEKENKGKGSSVSDSHGKCQRCETISNIERRISNVKP